MPKLSDAKGGGHHSHAKLRWQRTRAPRSSPRYGAEVPKIVITALVAIALGSLRLKKHRHLNSSECKCSVQLLCRNPCMTMHSLWCAIIMQSVWRSHTVTGSMQVWLTCVGCFGKHVEWIFYLQVCGARGVSNMATAFDCINTIHGRGVSDSWKCF